MVLSARLLVTCMCASAFICGGYVRILQLAIICARSGPCGYVRILQLSVICADIQYVIPLVDTESSNELQ